MKLAKNKRNHVYPSDLPAADPIHTDHDCTSIACVIRWSAEFQEWQLFTTYQPDLICYTNDAEDAVGTAKAMLREGIRIRTSHFANAPAVARFHEEQKHRDNAPADCCCSLCVGHIGGSR